jgi:GDPmannose 4,6-dehydratase
MHMVFSLVFAFYSVLFFCCDFLCAKCPSDLPIAFITGVTGQDGSYLAEFLLKKGYEVHGLVHKPESSKFWYIQEMLKNYPERFFLHHGDLIDSQEIKNLLNDIRPHEIYNLAAQSNIQTSFNRPKYTIDVNVVGAITLLENLLSLELLHTKFIQASTSEIFEAIQAPQNELSAVGTRSPYGSSKLLAHSMVKHYRLSQGLFACNCIAYNHESPRRGRDFITRKISYFVASIAHGVDDVLHIGNLNAKKDWGYAPEYVEAMWLILQHPEAQDWVLSTGESHSVREFIEKAFCYIGIHIEWQGEGVNERGYNKENKKLLVVVDPTFFRPNDSFLLIGDSSKAKKLLEWSPRIDFDQLVRIMVDADIKDFKLK